MEVETDMVVVNNQFRKVMEIKHLLISSVCLIIPKKMFIQIQNIEQKNYYYHLKMQKNKAWLQEE